MPPTATDASERQPPGTIFLRFLKFGLLAWGGPVAQIAMLKRELVEEQHWLPTERFNRLLAAYQVLPGPEAHELCVHLGMMTGGRIGGILAGLGFMLPGLVLTLAMAWLYVRLDLHTPMLAALFLGMQVGVFVALIVRAVHRIAGHVLVDAPAWFVGFASAAATMLGVSFWLILPASGLFYALWTSGRRPTAIVFLAVAAAGASWGTGISSVELPVDSAITAGTATAAALFLSGLKAGLLTFGGAYTAIPFVREDAVGRGWITDRQFLDSIALTGVLPAPLIIFATFAGYIAAGLGGALAITVGIFLPAFAFALLFSERLEKIAENDRLHRILEGVAAGVVGLIAVTAVQLGVNVAGSAPLPVAAVVFAVSLALLYFWKSKLAVLAVVAGSGMGGIILF
ncbi:chromate efflux transporter [Sphingomonas edaphi]|uniref:Chromate efflux transporter n=1 Tax=Sphingomonas edaphi TaxID=2315689 RepID=A0A418Q002_9SPHN|nr:chromate efflux transporter [Sphingomonas edaphi]RIX29325.1 chromate efflux transporter [Sphingomonas edaphi]